MAESKFKPIPSTLTDAEKSKFNVDDRNNKIDVPGVFDSRTSGRVLGVTWQLWDENIGQRQQDINQELYDLAYAGL